jgi:hypothetical protein
MASSSETWPQNPPIAQAPKLISETFQPVRPNGRYFISLALPDMGCDETRKYKRLRKIDLRLEQASCATIFFFGR